MISFALFFGLNWLLGFIPNRPLPVEDLKPSSSAGAAPEKDSRPYLYSPFIVLLIMIVATPTVVARLGSVAPRKLKQPLNSFSLNFNGRSGIQQTMDPEVWQKVGGQDYFLADYDLEGPAPINFYVAYYEYQKKAGDFIHSPKLCLPGAGWFIDLNHVREIDSLDGQGVSHKLKFNELIIRKGDRAQLVYFWYQGRDRNFTSEWAAKFYMVWDGIWRRRTDGALVRLVMPLVSDDQVDPARQSMDRFALEAFQVLDRDFLP